MKRYVKKIWAFVLCLALCMGSTVPAMAANADNVTFSATLDKETIQKASVDQTVVLTLSASKAFTAGSIGFDIDKGELDSLAISAVAAGDGTENSEWQYAGTKVDWTRNDAENVSTIQEIVSITFVVPANTAAGSYTIGIKDLEITKDYGDIWENAGTATTTLTITDAETTGYTAGISASETALEVNDSVNIHITADHASAEAFAATEITVGYDSSVLSFNADTFKASYPNVSADTTVAGTLKLVDYGESKAFGETGYVYNLPFKATNAADNTNVTLSYAGFATKTEAETRDLSEAAYNPKSVTLNISMKSLSVTLPEGSILTGSSEVAYGGDYTFSLPEDGKYYDYSEITATVGGTEAEVLDNNDGTYTIANVTGDVVISCSGRTAKSYTVTIEGTGAEDVKAADGTTAAAKTATYGQPYIFTIPADSVEYSYTTAVAIDGTVYTGTGFEAGEVLVTYTIPDEAIIDDIVITVTKTKLTADEVAVTIPSGVDVTGEEKAVIGQPYTLTLTEEAGYVYDVTATMGGEAATLSKGTDGDGKTTYTIANVTGVITFSVTKSVDTNGISVSQYVTLDGTTMWLVENTTAVAEGKVPTYNGQNMFWSDEYGNDTDGDGTNDGAYCYLIISDSAQDVVLATAKVALGITTGSAATIAYDNDVNETNNVDASDAQLVWNMYSAQYSDFTTDVTMAKFLEADVNSDKSVDMNDAAAVVAAALARTE